jgi:hypothetical protein
MSAQPSLALTPRAMKLLDQVVTLTGKPAAEALESALDAYFRAEFIRLGNEGYAALQADPEAWAAYQAELKEWDAVLMDGLDPNEHWQPDGTCEIREPREAQHGQPTPR